MTSIEKSPTHPAPGPKPDPPGARKPGIRIGPFIFVPELLTAPGDDPWASRKGEPRIFALLWCTYLMVSALLTIFSVRYLGIPDSDEYRGACIMMCVLGGVGAAILWPALRLCQQRPRHVVRSVLVDALIVAAPLQGVIWPMPMLTDWRWSVAMGIGAAIGLWTLITGALIAWGYLSGKRLAAMSIALGLAMLAPAGLLATRGLPPVSDHAPAWAVLSPLTAPWALAWSTPGWSPAMSGAEWRAIVGLGVVGGAALVALQRLSSGQRH